MKASRLAPLAILILSTFGLTLHGGAPLQAQADSRLFAETGQSVAGKFLQYWDAHGGLAQQGYPISAELQEVSAIDGKPYTVQYFERAVFELHPENQPPYDVLLSLLGRQLYRQKYPNGAPGQTPNSDPGAAVFAQTSKRLGGKFLAYWQRHGGLAQQGYPISDEFTETSPANGKPYTVQYFERAVFELHPENQPPYDVLLSLLGKFQYKARYEATTPPTAVVAPPTATPAPPIVDFVAQITGDPNRFNQPSGVAVDSGGNLYVVDSLNNRIQKFGADRKFRLTWGSAGSGDGQFEFRRSQDNGLGGVAVDAQGNVYVADSRNSRIQKFSADGQFLLKWGGKGTGDGQFVEVFDVAVDGQGNIYAIDDRSNNIQKFDASGRLLLRWGSAGSADGQLLDTGGLAVDAQGNVFVADAGNNRIQKFGSNGQFLQKWDGAGSGAGQFRYPNDVTVDSHGNIYVVDSDNNRVQKFDANGQWLGMWGGIGNGLGQFRLPDHIAVDGQDNIYVSDYHNNRVQKFHAR